MAKQGISYEHILSGLRKKSYKPVYLLMGEEAYYIDKISDRITSYNVCYTKLLRC